MVGQTVIFDGHRLNDKFFVGEVDVGMPTFSPRTEDREFADGMRMRGMRLGCPDIAVTLVAKPVRGETAREPLTELMSWLHVDSPRQLHLSDDRGLWRMCVPNGAPEIQDTKWNDRIVVTFLQIDPALYGTRREIAIPSGSTVTFVVGGDYPTKPTITSTAAVRNSSQQWGVRLDDGDFMRVGIPVSTASRVSMDCTDRTCKVNGATTAPTITSDWFELAPGAHKVRNDIGSGACVMSWYERWHR